MPSSKDIAVMCLMGVGVGGLGGGIFLGSENIDPKIFSEPGLLGASQAHPSCGPQTGSVLHKTKTPNRTLRPVKVAHLIKF